MPSFDRPDLTSITTNMKHSRKSKKLQEPRHPKFSCFLACFGGGQPSGKKLVFDHSKKSPHNHRWLLSPYWSKVRLKRSVSGSKTVPFELFGVSPTPSVTAESLAGSKTVEYENIAVVEKADHKADLISREALKSSDPKIPISLEDGEKDLCHITKQSDSKGSNKTQPSTRLSKSCMPEKPSSNASIRLSKLDPLFGLSMVMLTLIIMIIWGRLCAILCTSAWLYFVPRFHWKEEKDNSQNENLNLKFEKEDKSWRMKDYKKRVILEGFLERENPQSLTGYKRDRGTCRDR